MTINSDDKIIDAILDSDLNIQIIPDVIERSLYKIFLDKLRSICKNLNILIEWICCRNNDIVLDSRISKED